MTYLDKLGRIALTGMLVLGLSSAQAAAILTLDDGTNPVISIVDGGVGDANGLAGVVTYVGSLGSWALNVSTGANLSNGSASIIDLSSINAIWSGSGNSTLKIGFTQTGLTAPGLANASGRTDVGGTTTGSVSFATYFNGGLVSNIGPLSTPAFSASNSFGGLDTTSAFSLTNLATITQTGGGVTSFDMYTQVPEPSTLGLLGLGLLGLGFARRRKVS